MRVTAIEQERPATHLGNPRRVSEVGTVFMTKGWKTPGLRGLSGSEDPGSWGGPDKRDLVKFLVWEVPEDFVPSLRRGCLVREDRTIEWLGQPLTVKDPGYICDLHALMWLAKEAIDKFNRADPADIESGDVQIRGE